MLTGARAALAANAAAEAANAAGATISTASINNIITTTIIAATNINIEVIILRHIDVTGPIAAAANAPLPPPTSRCRLGALQTEALVISRRLAYERYVRRLAAYLFIKP